MPQLEDGYVRIANELWEAFCRIRIPGEARQVMDAIIRKTYGYNKKEDAISITQLTEITGLKRPHVCRGISRLLTMNIITKKDTSTPTTYGINKIYSMWRGGPKKDTSPKKGTTGSPQKDNLLVPKKVHTKDNIKTILKTKRTLVPQALKLSGLLALLILKNNPDYGALRPKKRGKAIQKWAVDIEKLNRIDGRSWSEIEEVLRWSQVDSFWHQNILSGGTLRKQFDKLSIKMKQKPATNNRTDEERLARLRAIEEKYR